MATEVFNCESCDYSGKITYKPIETRFLSTICYCPFCGADLEVKDEDEIEVDEDD